MRAKKLLELPALVSWQWHGVGPLRKPRSEQLAMHAQGRDATRNLNRSIRAKKLLERLPAHVQDMAGQLQDWHAEQGSPFMLDSLRYLVRPLHTTPACCSLFARKLRQAEPREQLVARIDSKLDCSNLLAAPLLRPSCASVPA